MVAMGGKSSLRTQPLPKLQWGLLYVAAIGIGLIPYVLLVKSPLIWLGLVLLTTVVFVVVSRSRSEYAGQAPWPLEIALSMLGRCAAGAMTGLFGIGIFYGVSGLLSWLDLGTRTGLDPWAVYGSAVFVGLLIIAITEDDVRDTINALYPDRPGQRSPYLPLATQPSANLHLALRILVIIGAAALVFAAGYLEALASYFVFAVITLNVVLVGVGADYLEAKTIDSVHGTPESAVSAVKALLEAGGYRVILRPRTGNEEADSVISILDFLAIRSDRAMAGRVKARADGADNDLRYEAAALEPAVWVLQDQLQEQQKVKIRLRPVLVVLGNDGNRSEDNSPLASSAGKSVKIVRTPSTDQLAAMINSDDKALLKKTAEQLFGTSTFSTGNVS